MTWKILTVDGGMTSAITSISGIAGCRLGPIHRSGLTPPGTVTLFGMCCSRGVFGHAYLNRVGAVCGSGSGVECGDIVPLSESVCHLGSPLGGTESMASWSKMP